MRVLQAVDVLAILVVIFLSGFAARSEGGCYPTTIIHDPCQNILYLDAGHGGADVGTSNSTQYGTLYEKDVNLNVALKVEDIVRTWRGVEVFTSRCWDTYVDVNARWQDANFHWSDMFLSVHHNSSGNQYDAVWSVHSNSNPLWNTYPTYGWDITASRYLGDLSLDLGWRVRTELSSWLGIPDGGCWNDRNETGTGPIPGCGALGAAKAVVRNAQMPCTIGEGWFITNDVHAERYQLDPDVQGGWEASGYANALYGYMYGVRCGYVPVIPGTFSAAGQSQSVRLTWSIIPEGGEVFMLYRSDNCSGPYTWIGTVNAGDPNYTSNGSDYYFTDDGVQYSIQYEYRLLDFVTGGGPYTFYATATPLALPVISRPGVPAGVNAVQSVQGGVHGIEVSWGTAAGATGYRLYKSRSSAIGDCYDMGNQASVDVAGTSFFDSDVDPQIPYFYRVQAHTDLVNAAALSPNATTAWTVGVDDGVSTSLTRVRPNPFSGATTIEYTQRSDGRLVVEIFDVAGRRIRLLRDTLEPAGSYVVVWDGRDDVGKELSRGIYFASVKDHLGSRVMKLTLLR